ncbi:MAG TPA: cyclic pyranopterin monophosphate synthase MoaC [Nitrospiria bacterium]|jgi:cyclic pyranopterin phosphate synthase|nr:cyclic pyranopterin monophosphate synthase MoaC [Nitrospiria bacterium]
MALSHLDESGRARMVDVGGKPRTARTATAVGKVYLKPETLRLVRKGGIAKGDVLAVAQVAGVMAAKQVPSLIPLCHPLLLSGVEMRFKEEPNPDSENRCSIGIEAVVKAFGPTGVEMEAMTAVCAAALTIYDMCKAVDREMSFGQIMLVEKAGGKSGTYRRPSQGGK